MQDLGSKVSPSNIGTFTKVDQVMLYISTYGMALSFGKCISFYPGCYSNQAAHPIGQTAECYWKKHTLHGNCIRGILGYEQCPQNHGAGIYAVAMAMCNQIKNKNKKHTHQKVGFMVL